MIGMSKSPLIFTYNNPNSGIIDNNLEVDPNSPYPGISNISLYRLESQNLILNGVTLTIQFYANIAKSLLGQKTDLRIQTNTIVASTTSDTIGTLCYTRQYQNPLSDNDPIFTRTRNTNTSSYISSASGIFSDYLFGNIIHQSDNSNGNRTIYVYSPV